MDYGTILPFVIPVISGGVAGALVNWYVGLRKQRTDTALKVIEVYFSMYIEFGNVKGFLLKALKTALNDDEENRVRKAGDWFELVATLYQGKYIDRNLLKKLRIPEELKDFYKRAENTPKFEDVVRQWPNLQGLSS